MSDAIDVAHLDRQTFGEKALRDEILGLFIAEAPLLLSAMRATANSAALAEIAHRLKGSALAIGAGALALAAAAFEQDGGDAGTRLSRLEHEVRRAIDAAERLKTGG
jgi:HPt (histidine-containing phosphotransfer) domain-containing protein